MVKNPRANAGNIRNEGLILGSGRSPGGGHGNPFQYSFLENPHGQRSLVSYGVAELDTQTHTNTHTHMCVHTLPKKKPAVIFMTVFSSLYYK